MQNNLFTTLKETLKTDERFISSDWYLLKNIIRENAINLDEKLIWLLLDNEILKKKFFIKIKDSLVFDSKNFINFLNNKEFLENSFTRFKNKVWLSDKKWDFLASSNEIVLSWPYKDCILAWWQSKDDTKREEIFYNEILASDDIDRLLDEKVFINFKRISKVWEEVKEEKLDTFKRDAEINKKRGLSEDTITDNLLIKWNNLLALHSLKKEFAWKVKLIYIDPPYNTWNDSFKYNDRFNHSTWLTFMKNRLEVAKDLLKDDWVIFVQCDDNEQAYLKVLMDEVFWIEKNINVISVKMSESKWLKNAHIEKKMPKNKEYILIYSKQEDTFLFNPEKIEKNEIELKWYVKYYNKTILNIKDSIEEWKIKSYKEWNDIKTKLKYKDSLIYMVKPDNDIKIDLENNKFWFIINSRWKKNIFYKNDKWIILKVLFLWENISKFLWDLWTDISTININKESWVKTLSNWQKPEKLIERIINLSTNPWDIVLDYHLWSGTTCAVAHKMGRQYIGVEQMDYIETISKERLKKVIEWEQGGISKNVDWKGWGDFVYMEIMKENEKFIKEIECAWNDKELLSIYEKIKNSEFINYFVDIEKIDENLKNEDNKNWISFADLSMENKKRFLIELLDKNLLYKNYSEIDDENSWVNEEDKKLNREFYK